MNYLDWKFSFDFVPYDISLAFMQNRVQKIHEGSAREIIWLLEHPSLYTGGVSAHAEDLINKTTLPVYHTNRGGQYTYHGPGQRVVYVMLNLKRQYESKPDLTNYIFRLEQWIINTLAVLKLKGERRAKKIGVWIVTEHGNKEEKIAAIGVKIKKWITYHGVAFNVNPELSYYKGIVPCGIRDHGVTSLHKLGINLTLSEIDEILYKEFYKIF